MANTNDYNNKTTGANQQQQKPGMNQNQKPGQSTDRSGSQGQGGKTSR